jgi:hypothetical protein
MCLLYSCCCTAQVYWPNPQHHHSLKKTKRVRVSPFDTIAYPLRSKFYISVNGSALLKDLEFWVYDARGVEVYYSIQSIHTSEEFQKIVHLLIDKEFQEYMMMHGHVMTNRRPYKNSSQLSVVSDQ